MTIRDVVISFGYEINKASESAVNSSVEALKSVASDALEAIGVKFKTDKASEQEVRDSVDSLEDKAQELASQYVAFAMDNASEETVKSSIEAVKNEAEPLKKIPVRYEPDKASEKATINSMRGLKSVGMKVLRGLGIGASIMGAISMAKKFIDQNEDMQVAAKEINEEWTAWKKELNDTYGMSKDLANAMLKGFKAVMKLLRQAQREFAKLVDKVGGVKNAMKILAAAAGSLFIAMNAEKILKFMKSFNKMLSMASIKMLALFAVILIVALLVEDFIGFMTGKDSMIGAMLEKFGINADDVRDKIGGLWDKVKEFLPTLIELASTIGGQLLDGLMLILPHLINIASTIVPAVVKIIQTLIPIVMQIIDKILPVIAKLLETLLPIITKVIDTLMTGLEKLMPVITFVADLLTSVLGVAFEALMPIVDAVLGVFMGIIDFITSIFSGDWSGAWDAIVSIFDSIISGIAAIFKFPINVVIKGINKVFAAIGEVHVPDWVPIIGGKSISFPQIAELAEGGVLEKGQTGYLEGTGAEAVVPLERNTGWVSKVAGLFTKSMGIDIQSILSDMIQALQDVASLGIAPMSETVDGAVGSIENNVITLNVELNNKFEGDRAGQQKSAEAMDKASDDMLGQLSRALLYAR